MGEKDGNALSTAVTTRTAVSEAQRDENALLKRKLADRDAEVKSLRAQNEHLKALLTEQWNKERGSG